MLAEVRPRIPPDLLVITDSHETEAVLHGKTIRFMPLCKWLLDPEGFAG